MNIQTLTQLGNSHAIVIPAHILREAKFKRGQKFIVDYLPEADGVLIRPANKAGKTANRSDKEFKIWLDGFFKEDAALLDELAHR